MQSRREEGKQMHHGPVSALNTLKRIALLVVLSIGSPDANAANLRVVITWDHDYPVMVWVTQKNYPPPHYPQAVSHRTPACNRIESQISNATITGSPQIGRGPIEFVMDPVPGDIDLEFYARVDYCFQDGRDQDTNNLPRPPANVTVSAFEDGEPIYTGTTLTSGDQMNPGATLVYRYKMDGWIDFDLKPYPTSGFERMVVNVYRTDIPAQLYPSPWQEPTTPPERPRFRITGRLMTRRGSLPNTPIYLRVIDPPDEADYVISAGHAAENDNADPEKRGRLEAEDGTVAVNGAVLSIRTDASGRFAVALRGTSRYAGDNYLVEGSGDSGFLCSSEPSGCGRTATITAWKRSYIEHSSMFKRSAFITTAQDPAKRTLRVDRSSELCVGCLARLIHSPVNGGGSGFYYEDAKITGIKQDAKSKQYVVTLDRVLSQRFLPAPQVAGQATPPAHWGDAIGIIDSTQFPNGDYYHATNDSYLSQVFPAAFVEYVVLPERMSPRGLMPHVPVMAAEVSPTNRFQQNIWIDDFSRRWFQNDGRPNHQHFVAADRNVVTGDFGYAQSTRGRGQAHIFLGKITGAFGLSAADWRLAGEIGVHELAHTWHVNWDFMEDGTPHCTTGRIFSSSYLTCTMHPDPSKNIDGDCAGICSEYSDGLVGFHYRRETRQSEYMYIRHRRDPMPFDDSMEP